MSSALNMSLVNIVNRMVPMIDPCGTPSIISSQLQIELSNLKGHAYRIGQ